MTAGATESLNLAFSGHTGHVVTTTIEHQAVLAAAARYDHTLVAVDANGRVDPAAIKDAISSRHVAHQRRGPANNEIGTVQPLVRIAEIVHGVRAERLEQQQRHTTLPPQRCITGCGAGGCECCATWC